MQYEIDVREIKAIMGRKGLTNSALAEKLNINRNTLRSYFNNPQKIPYETILKMASVLEIEGNELSGIFFKEKLTKNAS